MHKKSSYSRLIFDLETAILSVPIVYIPHYDYSLIESALRDACETFGLKYDSVCSRFMFGLGDLKIKSNQLSSQSWAKEKLDDYLKEICQGDLHRADKYIYLIENVSFGQEDISSMQTADELVKSIGWLQLIAQKYYSEKCSAADSLRTIVLVDPDGGPLPSALEKIVSIIEVMPPTMDEIKALVDKKNHDADLVKGGKGIAHNDLYYKECAELSRSLQGLHQAEIQQILNALTIDTAYGDFIPGFVKAAMREKKRIVQKSGLLEVIETDVKLDELGGLSALKDDIRNKSVIYKEIRVAGDVFHVPIPKGILILGMPGCGKSVMAKAIANEFDVGLLRLDMNKILGQYVGQSEQNFRKVLDLAEAASPCVLWIDEIEKAFSGTNGAAGEGGSDVVMRMMGLFLTWMQEHTKPVYIVATANDVMRPEFMRKGRFDEVYYVGFPDVIQAVDIFNKKMETYNGKTKEKGLLFARSIKEQLEAFKQRYLNEGSFRDRYDKTIVGLLGAKDIDEKNEDDVVNKVLKDCEVNGSVAAAALLSHAYHFTGAEIENVVNQAIEREFISIVKAKEIETAQREITIGALIKIAKSLKRQRIAAHFDVVRDSIVTRHKKGEDVQSYSDPISKIFILQLNNQFKDANKDGRLMGDA